MNRKTIKEKAVAHYDRMIEWAEKQHHRNHPYPSDMLDSISEMWNGEYCEYCKYYTDNLGCSSKCLLNENQGTGCCGNLWEKMNDAKTWGTWVKRAKLVRQYIIENG